MKLIRFGQRLLTVGTKKSLFTCPVNWQRPQKKPRRHKESAKAGLIEEYLNRLLPEDWAKKDIGERRRFIHGSDFGETDEGTVKRERVCAMEIWVELFEGDPKQMTPIQAREINDVLRRIPGWKAHTKDRGRLYFGKNYGYQRAFVRE